MRLVIALAILLLAAAAQAKTAQEYLPSDADPDPSVPTPESVLGWEVGDWHVSHDKLVEYLRALASASPRVNLKVIGHTHEQRPLLQLAVTSEANQQNLESLRREHLEGSGPLVVWLGYSVHGDEPSGSNAALLAAYYLASSRSEAVRELLDGSVILIDPAINPDGLNRFASWANSNAGRIPVTDPAHRQHVQAWPDGRTNHYLFDLNRDWLPLVHPESRARIVEYHRWLPHVLTDHHEQDRFPGFFFQPGVPSRQNPLTPDENLELTRELAQFHASAMDRAGQPFFTEEAYDDFYYGKGSTYPDVNGSVGILFEQRAILGQALSTDNGTETFRMAVANQVRMTLSTLQGAWALRDRLMQYQNGFHEAMLKRADRRGFAAWVVGDDGDPQRARAFLDVLNLHRIEYRGLAETVRAGEREFSPGQAWVIPARQKQFGLLEALMEQRTRFEDNTFYDVSAWTQPLAYNLPFATLSRMPDTSEAETTSSGTAPDSDAAAWAIPWNQMQAPALLQELLDAGARVRSATRPFSSQTRGGLRAFPRGTLLVQAGVQAQDTSAAIREILVRYAMEGTEVVGVPGSMTVSGPDLGSRYFAIIDPVRPLIVGGAGVASYGAGEQWHLLDQRLGVPAVIVEQERLGEIDIWNYTHLLIADGEFKPLDDHRSMIARWVKDGGVLVAVGRAATWAEGLCFNKSKEDCETAETVEENGAAPAPRAYSDFSADRAEQVIGGAIVATVLDLSHPLAFGYRRAELPVFRRGTTVLKPSENAYSTPVRYTADPLLAGFVGEDRLAAFRGQPAVIAEKRGKGLVVRFANSPLFRGFWRGTERLFVNALYLGQVVESTELPEFEPPPRPETPRQH